MSREPGQAHPLLAYELQKAGRFNEARQFFDIAIIKFPEDHNLVATRDSLPLEEYPTMDTQFNLEDFCSSFFEVDSRFKMLNVFYTDYLKFAENYTYLDGGDIEAFQWNSVYKGIIDQYRISGTNLFSDLQKVQCFVEAPAEKQKWLIDDLKESIDCL